MYMYVHVHVYIYNISCMQSDGGYEGWIGILETVQRLVEELTVLLSSLDQGNTTQLPQQVSTYNIHVHVHVHTHVTCTYAPNIPLIDLVSSEAQFHPT